ncbi:2Fe-2S ferredoxin-type domain-containing protein [Blastocladiella britannica]|nr:2Fe-2S ferredoxin-type domain-containing protein [Blastocladiella britannica]
MFLRTTLALTARSSAAATATRGANTALLHRQPRLSSVTSQRTLHASTAFLHGGKKASAAFPYTVTYVTSDGEEVTVRCEEGDNLLDVAHSNDIDLEGACEGSLACSTCHVIVDPKFYDRIPEPTDEEYDMLDLAFAPTDTSRLGCQVVMCKELDGIRVRIPSVTRNMAVDGFKPKPH